MTEPTIPSWSSMKKYYKETGSAVFPTPDSIQKRDPKIDYARSQVANQKGQYDIAENARQDVYNNPVINHTHEGNTGRDLVAKPADRNPVPAPQPERKDIPLNRDKYEDYQRSVARGLREVTDNDPLREYLTKGLNIDPDILDEILYRLHSYHSENASAATRGRMKTGDVVGLPWDPELQHDLIQPGRR